METEETGETKREEGDGEEVDHNEWNLEGKKEEEMGKLDEEGEGKMKKRMRKIK